MLRSGDSESREENDSSSPEMVTGEKKKEEEMTKSLETTENVIKEDETEEKGSDWLALGASWGSSWLQSAKEKTISTLELVKKDLSEFSDAMHLSSAVAEAGALASTTAEAVKQQAQNLQHLVVPETKTDEGEPDEPSSEKESQGMAVGWMKTLLDSVKSLAQEDTTSDEKKFEERIVPSSNQIPQHRLLAVQTDINTYLNTPEGDQELFEFWLEDFSLSDQDAAISSLLTNSPSLRAVYAQLVPSQVSNADFWQRYFYKIHQLQTNEKLRHSDLSELSVTTAEPGSVRTQAQNVSPSRQVDGPASPDRRSSVSNGDETWSVCSTSNIDIQEIPDETSEVSSGQLTPRADQSKSQQKGNGEEWVDWEE